MNRKQIGLQISIRKSSDVTVLDLRGRSTIDGESELLSSRLKELVANGVRKLLLNLVNLTQVDTSWCRYHRRDIRFPQTAAWRTKIAMPVRPGAGGADRVSPARHYPKL